ncbi:zinc finger protein 385D isoform X2 [Ambystoma mexicanum]|uniref:zinc finger protein 385D isoform X2 n=1 Tax=Ambystoma mexicanum TaxID=8296 RepID=UPI0037E714E5
MRNIMYFGGTCQSPALPTLVRSPLPALQPTLDIKSFFPFSLDSATAAAVNLFPNFNVNGADLISCLRHMKPIENMRQMDPIQKAVINHTFGVPLAHRRKQIASCSVCQLRFNSDSQAAAHYKGTKHAKKLKAQEAVKSKQRLCAATKDSTKTTLSCITASAINTNSVKTESSTAPPAILPTPPTPVAELQNSISVTPETLPKDPPPITTTTAATGTAVTGTAACPSAETEEEKAKRLLYCSLCKVAVNSASQLEAHNTGTKHKTMVDARNGSGNIKAFPRAGVKGKTPVVKGNTGLQNKTFHCEICDVHVNSETQLKQHISSRRHKDRAAGKPPKPKYSPYNKIQRGATPLGIKLAFSKEHLKPLAPRIVQSPLAAAAAAAAASMAANSPFSFRTGPAPTLFQSTTLQPTLLRPAPGPIRTTHTPVLFAPY